MLTSPSTHCRAAARRRWRRGSSGAATIPAVERAQLEWAFERDCRFLGPDHHALAPHFFFDGTPIEADKPLVINPTGAVAGSCFFFGFLVSRLPRLCSLAMMSSWTEPSFRVGICETQKAPCPMGPASSPRRAPPRAERSAASFVSSRRYIRRRRNPDRRWLHIGRVYISRVTAKHGRRRCDQTRTSSLSADILPLFRSETSSKPTF